MIKSQLQELLAQRILMICGLLFSLFVNNMLYAQRADDIPQKLVKKNKVKSMTTYLTTNTKGTDNRSFKDFAVGKVLYDRNGNKISDKTYIWWDITDYVMADSTAYDEKNKLIEMWSKQFITVTNNPNTFIKTIKPFVDSQSKTAYEYDVKGNLLHLLSIGKEGSKVLKSYIYDNSGNLLNELSGEKEKNKVILSYLYDDKKRIIKKIEPNYNGIDTILYKYNQRNKCIEEIKHGNNSYKNITTYNKDGLKEKLELYKDEKSRGRTMDKPWRTYLYFYNDKNQLIKEEARHPEPKKDLATYYNYYENDLLKEKREEMTSTYIFTNQYEYWD